MKYKFFLGYKKDKVDHRDLPMAIVLPPIKLPDFIDYTNKMSPVGNQGDEGTCVAFASVDGVKEYQEKKERNKYIDLSVRYVYWCCKRIDGMPNEEGTHPRVAMKVLQKYGVPPEKYWPYKPHQTDKPKKNIDKIAKPFKILAYARLNSVLEMKRSLVINGPFLVGVVVFDNWMTEKVANTGFISFPRKKNKQIGGHAICIVGYNENKSLFKFKNSWSEEWGDKGYGYLSYKYIEKFCMDAWSATDLIENPKSLVTSRERIIKKYKNLMLYDFP
ncbi:MAG: C1 family peptidase [Candidatus Firestonebacteria bacterium]